MTKIIEILGTNSAFYAVIILMMASTVLMTLWYMYDTDRDSSKPVKKIAKTKKA